MTSLKPKRLIGVALIFLMLLSSTAQAAPNYQINYQGKLTDAAGTAVADGTYAVTFNLYTAASGGSTIWTEAHTAGNKVTVTNGLFSTMLGSLTSLSTVDFNQTLYLGVTVESDSEMTPRKILGAVPAAFQADKLDNYDSTDFLSTTTASAPKLWTLTGLGQIGSSTATTTFLGNLTAVGTTVLNGILSVYQNVTAPYFTATSTDVASTFPYASTTAISATTASSSNLIASTAATFSFLGSGLTKVTNGALGLATAGTDYLTSAFKDWQLSGGYLTPTTTQTVKLNNGFVSTASSTVSGALTVTGVSNLSNQLYVGGASGGNFVGKLNVGDSSNDNGWIFDTDGPGTNSAYITRVHSSGSQVILRSSSNGVNFPNDNIGLGTSTPGTLLSLGNTGNNTINFNPNATSTFGSGINIRSGCFAIGGTCLSANSGFTFGQTWEIISGYLTPTTTQTVKLNNGFVSTASSTVSGLLTLGSASSTALTVSGYINTPSIVSGSDVTISPTASFTVDNSTYVSLGTAAGGSFLLSGGGTSLTSSSGSIGLYPNSGVVDLHNSQGGATDGAKLAFWDSGSAVTRIYLDSSQGGVSYFNAGNVGVGTDTPYAKLSVVGQTVSLYFTATSTTQASTFPYASTTAISATTASSSNLIASTAATFSFLGSGLTKVTSGVLSVATAGTDYLTSAFQNWQLSGGYLTPTTTQTVKLNNGFVSAASSTVSGDLTVMGNVGVGTSSPSRAFVLSGTNPFLRVNNDSTGNSALEFSTLGVSKGFIGTAGSANGLVSGSVAGDMIIRTQGKSLLFTNDSGTTAHMVLSAAGLLGISSTTPTYLLSLGTGSTAFSVSSTGVATSSVFNAVSTSVPSIFPYASTTALTVAGVGGLNLLPLSGSGEALVVVTGYSGTGYKNNIYSSVNTGTNASNYLRFDISNSAGTSNEVMRINGAGNVGLGTTTPGEKLSVDGNGLFNGKITGQYFIATSTTVGSIFPYASTTALSVSGAGSAFIVSTGNVGIGNAVPTTTLDVIGTPSFIGRFAKSSTDSATAPTTVLGANYLQIGGQEYNAANTSPSLRLIGFGYNKAKTTEYSPAYIGFKETDNSASTLGNLVFYTRAVGTGTTQPSERLTIQSDGNVGVSSTTPFYLLSVGTGSSAFSVSSTGVATSTVFNAVSTSVPSIFPLASTTALTISGAGNVLNVTNSSATTTILGDVNIAGSTGVTIWTNEGNSAVAQGSVSIGSASPGNGLRITRLGGTDTTFFRATEAGGAILSIVDGTGIQLDMRDTGGSQRVLLDTNGNNFISPASGNVYFVPAAGAVAVGTTTPSSTWAFQVASAKKPFVLSDTSAGTNLKHWAFASQGGNLYIATSTDVYATSTISALTVNVNGFLGLGTTTPGTLLSLGNTGNNTINLSTSATSTFGTGINIRGGCYAINGTCISGSGSGSGTVNSSSDRWIPYYAGAGTTLSGTSTIRLNNFRSHTSVILGDESGSLPSLGALQLYGSKPESSALTYTNASGNEGLVINSYYNSGSDSISSGNTVGYADFVAQRFSQTGVSGGSMFRFLTQPFSSSNPDVAFLIDEQKNVAIYGGTLNGGKLNSSSVGNGMDLAISGGSTASSSSGTVKIAVGYLYGGSGTEVEGGHGGNVIIAAGGNSDNTASAGFPAAGNAGNVYLAMGGDGTNGSADGNDGTVQIGGGFKNNAILNVYGDVKVRLSPTGGAVSTFGVCHDGTDINATGNTSLRKLVACSAAPSDVAEMYPTKSEVEPGDIVAASSDELEYMAEGGDPYNGTVTDLGTTTISILKRATKGESGVLGVISTGPFQTFGRDIQKVDGANAKPVALVGRVPVKVTLEGGDIKPGDRITLSSTPGVGMKASTSGMSIGVAISSFNSNSPKNSNGIGMVNVFVNLSYAKLDSAVTGGNLADGLWTLDESTGRIKAFSSLDLNNMDINNVRSIQSGSGDWSISADGILVVKEVRTQKLCLGQICITETDLKSLLDHAGLGAVITAPSGDTGGGTGSTTPPSGGGSGGSNPPTDPPATDPTSTGPLPSDTPPPTPDPTPSSAPDPAPAPAPDPTPTPAADPPPSSP